MPMAPITLLAAGDVSPSHSDEGRNLDSVRALLRGGDITFGQLEEPLSNRGARQLYAGLGGPLWDGQPFDPAAGAAVLADAGFDVMSFAGNHTMDRSEDSALDTIEAAAAHGIPLIGAGRNIAEARTPVIIERDGLRVGFLGYCSVLPPGYAAERDKPGVAPLRADTFYQQVDWQPGTAPRVITRTHEDDLAAMVADIEALRPRVDILITSVHWGVHFEPGTIADYQYEAGHAAIDAGADAVLGHHAHILKGIEVYRGRPIVYSLNNFVLRPRGDDGAWLSAANTPSEQQKSIMVKLILDKTGVTGLAVLPVWLDERPHPVVPEPSDPRAESVLAHLRCALEQQHLGTTIQRVGDEFLVDLG